MTVRFYVNQFRQLEVEMDNEREMLINPRFMQNESKTKAAEYLRPIAERLTELYNAGDVDAGLDLLEEAKAQIFAAQTAEKFCEEVTFSESKS